MGTGTLQCTVFLQHSQENSFPFCLSLLSLPSHPSFFTSSFLWNLPKTWKKVHRNTLFQELTCLKNSSLHLCLMHYLTRNIILDCKSFIHVKAIFLCVLSSRVVVEELDTLLIPSVHNPSHDPPFPLLDSYKSLKCHSEYF